MMTYGDYVISSPAQTEAVLERLGRVPGSLDECPDVPLCKGQKVKNVSFDMLMVSKNKMVI